MHLFAHKTSPLPSHVVRLLVCALLPACVQHVAAAGGQPMAANRPRSSSIATAANANADAKSAPHAPPVPSGPVPSNPYLWVCPPPALRFAEPIEIVDPVSAAAILGLPYPPNTTDTAAQSSPAENAANPPAAVEGTVNPADPMPNSTAPVLDGSAPGALPAAAPAETGVAILPDETPREIRSEDVLLYFQYPQAAPGSIVPPPSSATYRQQ